MNDEFLYDLRQRPSTDFALRLKSKLDRQQAEVAQRRRSFAWFIAGGLLVGSSALALVSPVIIQVGRDLIVQLRGDEKQTDAATSVPQQSQRHSSLRWDLVHFPGSTAEPSQSATSAPKEAAEPLLPEPSPDSSPALKSSRQVALAPTGFSRTTLRIAYESQFADLVEKLSTSVEQRNTAVSVSVEEWPRNADVCRDTDRASNVHIVISDFRFLQGTHSSCNGFQEMTFAYRAIAIVVNGESTWLRTLSIDDLRKLREGESTGQILAWSQLRNEWPTVAPAVFGVSLTASELGRRFLSAADWRGAPSLYRATEDDASTLAQVERTFGSIGFVDFPAWRSGQHSVFLAHVSSDATEAVQPTLETIQDGRYPLRKTVWMYVRTDRPLSWPVWQAIETLPSWSAVKESGLIPLAAEDRKKLSKLVSQTSGVVR